MILIRYARRSKSLKSERLLLVRILTRAISIQAIKLQGKVMEMLRVSMMLKVQKIAMD